MNKKLVVSILISTGSYQKFIKEMFKLSQQENSSYVCISNVHMTIEAHQDKDFCNIVNNSNIATPDGMPLAKGLKFLYGQHQDRVAGMDLTEDLLRECEKREKSIFIYGSTDDTLTIFENKVKKDFPNLKIKTFSPPFRTLTLKEKKEHILMINKFNPEFVFVALGCPKQEKWMSEHKNKINSCMIGLGGAIEVYAGVKDRAPRWMQDYSLEWFYRFIQDPKRLWKRYLLTNSLFLMLFIIQYIQSKIIKEDFNEK